MRAGVEWMERFQVRLYLVCQVLGFVEGVLVGFR